MIPNARIPALIAITLTDWAREQGVPATALAAALGVAAMRWSLELGYLVRSISSPLTRPLTPWRMP